MIFVTDRGRMANNIFQYGQLYAWGREHGRKTMSMRFAYKYPDFKIAHTHYHHFFVYILAKLAAKLHLIPTVVFDGQGDFDQKTETIRRHKHVMVTGWSVRFPDLFEKYKSEIISLFDFSTEVRNTVNNLLGNANSVTIRLGVHIRRGDYATWCGGRYFFNDSQYIQVIKQFLNLHPNKRVEVFICSNDPQLHQDEYLQELPTAHVCFPKGSPAEDLCLLSECDYLIGALSTFTLIASMYRDRPLYWITDIRHQISEESFHPFNYQARHYDGYFIS